jgi:2-polyprenyl-3-methyl-5-hydroxy-6-metoxy-1,4-benzoquinol methylase
VPESAICVICAGSLGNDPVIQLSGYELWPCSDCGSWILLPRPSVGDQSAFHDSAAYFDHPYLIHRRAYTDAVERRCAAMFQRIEAVFDLSTIRQQKILDVGCDTGQFVLAASRKYGSLPAGIDVAQRAVERARMANVEAYVSVLEDASPDICDLPLITAIDVIEHIVDPRPFFESLAQRLRPGGITYVETPNIRSLVFRVGRLLGSMSGCRPAAVFERLFPREHVQYYSRHGLKSLAAACGLEVLALQSRPLPTDEIAIGRATKLGIVLLQYLDSLTAEGALLWAIFQRPPSGSRGDCQTKT